MPSGLDAGREPAAQRSGGQGLPHAKHPATSFELNVSLADGSSVPVLVTRKRVKNLNLRVQAGGSVVLSMPARCPVSTAEEFLARKADWIAAHIARRQELRGAGWEARRNADGTMPLWGARVDIAGTLGVSCGGVAESPDIERRIELLYKQEILARLPQIAARYENALGVHAARWSVRTMRTRWGSCTPKTGAIRINTRLAAHPPERLDFVVAHELTHLLEPSHNARFHALLDQVCPDNRMAAWLLRKTG